MFYPELSSEFSRIVGGLEGGKVVVLGHVRPDGDCIGSQVALCRLLRARGIDAVCLNGDEVPRRLKFVVKDTPFYLLQDLPAGDWAAVTVDCADLARVGEAVGKRFMDIRLSVDHHVSNEQYARHNLVEQRSAATAEILAGMAFDLGWPLDPLSAQALYVGIATDTGQFRFPTTTRRVFSISGRLIEAGADPATAGLEIYEQESIGKLKLLKHFLSSMKLECGGRACVGVLANSAFEESNADVEDTEGLVDYARSLQGVEIGALIEDRAGAIKGSLRAKDARYRVDLVAKQFSGGGHAGAAGFNVDEALESFYPKLIQALRDRIAEVDGKPC